MANDYFMRQLEGMIDALTSPLQGKEKGKEDKLYEISVSTDVQDLLTELRMMLLQEQINPAENLLFARLEQETSPALWDAAMQFYSWLAELPQETLARCQYTPEEIEEGRAAVRRLFGRAQD